MKVILSDTSPLHYLALIQELKVLPSLFGRIIVPTAVLEELKMPRTPDLVKAFALDPPNWLEIRQVTGPIESGLHHLDRGEQEAIMLAKELQADALLIDEVKGRSTALMQGLHTIGTLRILYDAALRDLCNLNVAYEKLQQTNFRAAGALYEHFLRLYKEENAP